MEKIMTTTPSQNPVPSGDVGDLLFNIKKVDEIVTSSAVKYADRFGVERYTIEGIRKNLAPLGKMYDDLTAANAAIASGEILTDSYFFIRSESDNSIADEYKNVAEVATATGESYPSTAFVEEVNITATEANERVNSDYSGDGVSVIDSSRFPSFSSIDGIYLPDFGITTVPYDGIFLVDKNGFALEAKFEDGDDQSSWVDEQVMALEAIAQQSRDKVASAGNTCARPTANYNLVLYYGQSLQNGTEGWPRLSKTQPFDNMMFGDSVMPTSPVAAAFTPRGGAALKPLIATCCDANGNALTDEQVAALAPGTIAYGESPVESCLNSWRRRHLDKYGIESDPDRLFVGVAAGVGGRTVAQLSKGANPNLYQRALDAINGVKAIADSEGKTFQVVAIVYMQGEQDYPSAQKQPFKEATLLLRNNLVNDSMSITGQTRPPAFITYQTGASFTRDTYDLAVGMAQLELADEHENWWVAGPYYQKTDKNGHPDTNGYRNEGEKHGEVVFKTAEEGGDWKPLRPVKSVYKDTDVLVAFHVPVPSLDFSKPFVINTAESFEDKGFSAIDRVGSTDTPIVIESVEIKGVSTVHLKLQRKPQGELIIRNADKTNHNGNSMLCDSSASQSLNKYTFVPDSGMYPSANIPELVGKYYDLRNWSVAFNITPEESI